MDKTLIHSDAQSAKELILLFLLVALSAFYALYTQVLRDAAKNDARNFSGTKTFRFTCIILWERLCRGNIFAMVYIAMLLASLGFLFGFFKLSALLRFIADQ